MNSRITALAALLLLTPACGDTGAATDPGPTDEPATSGAEAGRSLTDRELGERVTTDPALGPTTTAPESPRAAELRRAYDDYRRALINQDGATAALFLSDSTVRTYDRIRELALTGSESVVSRQTPTDKVLIFLARLRVPGDLLSEMDGRGYFAHTVDAGWADGDAVRLSDIGVVDLDESGERARGEYRVSGKGQGFFYDFVREDDAWRFDQLKTMEIVDDVIAQEVARSGITEDRAIQNYVETIVGERVTKDIWVPLVER